MFYDTGSKLYLQTDEGYVEVVCCVTDGLLEVAKVGGLISKRPIGAKRLTTKEVMAKYNLKDGETYPKRTVESTPSVAPQSGVPKAQPTAPKARK